VLITDRAEFPRYKACGGGIALRTERLLPFSIAPVTEASVSAVQLHYNGRHLVSKSAATPFARMVMRDRFDALLLDAAQAAGAEFRPATKVTGIERTAAGVRVTGDGFAAEAPLLIGADGANSSVGRVIGLGTGMSECAAWEVELRPPARVVRSLGGSCVLGMGYRPWGYAWAFPKAERLSVGVVLPRANGRALREAVAGFVRGLGLESAEVELAQGHKVRSRRGHEPIADDRVALVGDAAGLADEFTQEGIFYAVASGEMAAHAALGRLGGSGSLRAYEAQVDTELMPELRAARLIGYMFYGMVRRTGRAWLLAMHRLGFLWKAFFAAQRGDSSYERELARAPWLARAAAARVGRQ
jgi:flavin-dependent dehydrogenase